MPSQRARRPLPRLNLFPARILTALLLPGFASGAFAGTASEKLRSEPSAFLRSFAGSPVDWNLWSGEALDRAKREQKPIFLFMGFFSSELARAMRRQTFSNRDTAEWLNQRFVCVLVDREERPDLASLYQAYVGDVKQQSGWPLNVWLTPELQPYEGATYLSPSEDWGRPGFLKQAKEALDAWVADAAGCRRRAAEAVAQLTPATRTAQPSAWSIDRNTARLSAAADAWRQSFDPARGGYSDPPKLPEPELTRFLLRRPKGDREAALRTLRALSTSAVRDPLDGGFFRYASDAAWRLPYPQKVLADQARVALAFLDAAQGADTRTFERCARGALDFALSRLARPDGIFAAVQDATGDEFAGYYAWTESEIDKVLGADSPAFKKAHGAEPGGNVPAADDPSGVYASRNLLVSSTAEDRGDAASAARLLAQRDLRPPPPLDERATAGANGLMLAALARTGAQLGDPRYLKEAKRTLGAVKAAFLLPDGGLRHLPGSSGPGAPEDYAALALGCREFARAAHDGGADALAERLLARLATEFYDPGSRRYFAAPPGSEPGLFVRPYSLGDPLSAEALVVLARAPRERGMAIAAGLLDALDEGNIQSPGDDLLALAWFAEPGK